MVLEFSMIILIRTISRIRIGMNTLPRNKIWGEGVLGVSSCIQYIIMSSAHPFPLIVFCVLNVLTQCSVIWSQPAYPFENWLCEYYIIIIHVIVSIVGVPHVGEVWTFGSAHEYYNVTKICVKRAREYRVWNNVIFQYTPPNTQESETFFFLSTLVFTFSVLSMWIFT